MRTLYLYLLVVCCTLQSCSSFLEETPYNKITAGNFFTTAKEAEQGVNGLYFRLRELYRTGYLEKCTGYGCGVSNLDNRCNVRECV